MSALPRKAALRAFSLIEVTLAIGVVAIGLVAVLAIIPQGLNIVGDAADTATEARISQYIVGEINVTDWGEVESFNERRMYFDAEGIELYVPEAGGIPDDVEQVVYVAMVEVAAPLGSLPAAEELRYRVQWTLGCGQPDALQRLLRQVVESLEAE